MQADARPAAGQHSEEPDRACGLPEAMPKVSRMRGTAGHPGNRLTSLFDRVIHGSGDSARADHALSAGRLNQDAATYQHTGVKSSGKHYERGGALSRLLG